jgi:hypothetical protein
VWEEEGPILNLNISNVDMKPALMREKLFARFSLNILRTDPYRFGLQVLFDSFSAIVSGKRS